jgi:hypothetical protein
MADGCIVHTPAGIFFTCCCMTTDPGALKPDAAFSVLESVSSAILDTTSLLSRLAVVLSIDVMPEHVSLTLFHRKRVRASRLPLPCPLSGERMTHRKESDVNIGRVAICWDKPERYLSILFMITAASPRTELPCAELAVSAVGGQTVQLAVLSRHVS